MKIVAWQVSFPPHGFRLSGKDISYMWNYGPGLELKQKRAFQER